MTLDFLPYNYPANDITDGQYLYRSLGSFWTQVFKDKNALVGYTTGMAEELIQSYYNLIDVVKQYSVKEIAPLRKEKWLPIVIKKSEFNRSAFVFETAGAVFGYQSDADKYYPGQLFRFGFPKATNGRNVFSYSPNKPITKIGGIANRIISPSLMLIPGIDFIIDGDTIYFNVDLFSSEYIPKAKVVEDLGASATFKDFDGREIEDEYIILWAYNAELDEDSLYQNFGTLFDIKMPTSESYKSLLKGMMNLCVEGPTIGALTVALAALMETPTVIEPVEYIEDIYNDDKYTYVVTDKNAYRLPISHELNPDFVDGSTLYAGQQLADSFSVVDTTVHPAWWISELVTKRLAFASHVFAANVSSQLFFENSLSLLTYTGSIQWNYPGTTQWIDLCPISDITRNYGRSIAVRNNGTALQWSYTGDTTWNDLELLSNLSSSLGLTTSKDSEIAVRLSNKLVFPVQGKEKDVAAFQAYINQPANHAKILQKLNFIENYPSTRVINPLDFAFNNFFKNNTLLLKLSFYEEKHLLKFFSLFEILQPYLPPHVYVLVYINLQLPEDIHAGWNSWLSIPDFSGETFSADGSYTLTGERPLKSPEDPNYYKDYLNRLFCISVGPYRQTDPEDPESKQPLHFDSAEATNLDTLSVNNSADRENGEGIKCGLLRTEIPESIIPAGELVSRRPSTKEVPAILLIDF